jgi:hypothetical protein
MDNPETLATLDTQDTGQRQTKQGAIKNVQSRDTGNLRYTRHRQTKQGAIKNGQPRDTGNKTQDKDKQNKGPSRMYNPETLASLDTQDTGQRQTKQKIQHRKLKI